MIFGWDGDSLLELSHLGQMRDVFGCLEVSKGAASTCAGVSIVAVKPQKMLRMTMRHTRMDHSLKQLMAIEGLLLLHEEDVAHHGDTADGLAVVWGRPRDTIVVGVVGSIVLLPVGRRHPCDLGRYRGRAIIESLEDGRSLQRSRVGSGSACDLLDRLNWV